MSTQDLEDDSSDVECPTCGRTDFKNDLGVKRHHAKAHDEPIRKTVVCAWCGEEKEVIPSKAEKSNRHFCDYECKGEWQSENVAGEDHHNYDRVRTSCDQCGEDLERAKFEYEHTEHHFCDGDCYGDWRSETLVGEKHPLYTKHEVSCSECGKDKMVTQYEALEYEKHFCNNTCHDKWQSKHKGGKGHPLRNRIEATCDECGTVKEVMPCRASGKRYFCDVDCMAAWYSKHLTGEDHPSWEGGYQSPKYGPNWTEELREEIRKRQNRRCASCGGRQSDDSMALDVHHIQKAENFDYDDEERDHPDNLVAFCRSCHRKWEGIPLRPQLAD